MRKPHKTAKARRRGANMTPEAARQRLEALADGKGKASHATLSKLRSLGAQGTADVAPEGWAFTKTRLAERLCIHVHTITAALADPKHPKRGVLGYNVAECRKYYAARGTIGGDRPAELVAAESKRALAEARKETARAEILEHNAAALKEKTVDVEDVTEFFGNVASEAVARFRPVGQNVVAAFKLDPATAKAIADRIDAENRECLSKLAEIPWLAPDVKKKIAALGGELAKMSPLAFARPADLAPLNGLKDTSSLTPETTFRVELD